MLNLKVKKVNFKKLKFRVDLSMLTLKFIFHTFRKLFFPLISPYSRIADMYADRNSNVTCDVA